MCPSFSLWACRILKIRSCLRSPLAPGSSRERAMRVSSVMFFSFSSAMVMITYGSLQREVIRKISRKASETCEGSWGKIRRAGARRRLLKQPAAAARTLLQSNPLLGLGCWPDQHASGRRSSSPEHECWACETCEWPSKPLDKGGNGSAPYREHHKSNQSAWYKYFLSLLES